VVIVGEDVENDVNIIDMSMDQSKPCQSVHLPPIPSSGIHQQAVAFYNDQIMVCGGWKSGIRSTATDQCYSLAKGSTQWEVRASVENRTLVSAHSSVIGQEWFIGGGLDVYGRHQNDTWVYHGDTDTFTKGPPLPDNLGQACQVTVNDESILVVDGHKGYFLEWDKAKGEPSSAGWQPLSMTMGYGSLPSCGILNNPLIGQEVILLDVQGSRIYTSFYSMAEHDLRDGPTLDLLDWSEVPFLPLALAQLADGVMFSVGKTVYKFSQDSYQWIIYEDKMPFEWSYGTPVTVPDDFLSCP
jgi:hypothetical protein